uniref:Endo-1,31,4-beta-D-glucanase-like n=1 Tax=Tanacetum cinerariifolium TaxID=118510 RepID=A0A699HBU8_TANCI|nr:endo-1,3;1,4-beta-D-glucanase-like [Tanacetum cinerariifolium]
MHNMGKTIDELHALLIEYIYGLPKRLLHLNSLRFKMVESKNPIRNHKLLKGRVKEKGRNYPVYLAELMMKKKQAGTASTSEANRRVVELEEVQDKDITPYKNSSEHLVEVESFKPPQEDVALVRSMIVVSHSIPFVEISPQCCENPPKLGSTTGENDRIQEIGGLKSYTAGSLDSKLAVLFIADVFGSNHVN